MRRSARLIAALATLIAIGGGCQSSPQRLVARPAKHTIQSEQFTVQTNFRLPKDHPLLADLKQVERQVSETLHVPPSENPVSVYIFSDELEYRQFLEATFPGLPNRRAYFIGTPSELAVYTFWGDRIQEDLRHEFTHGLLHASLKNVPLWLDEGLAEYFEVAGDSPGGVHPEYTQRLGAAVTNGWQPDLPRLERLEQVAHMHQADYQEAWAWVHFMLHGSDDGRDALLGYVADLRGQSEPKPISERLVEAQPNYEARLVNYVGTLRPATAVVRAASTPH